MTLPYMMTVSWLDASGELLYEDEFEDEEAAWSKFHEVRDTPGCTHVRLSTLQAPPRVLAQTEDLR